MHIPKQIKDRYPDPATSEEWHSHAKFLVGMKMTGRYAEQLPWTVDMDFTKPDSFTDQQVWEIFAVNSGYQEFEGSNEMWEECPEWCYQDECEAGWHQMFNGFWFSPNDYYLRLNRNYHTGAVEFDVNGTDSGDYNVTLSSDDDLRKVLKHIDALSTFLSASKQEIERHLNSRS